jgi:O-antigen ligase
MSHDVDRGDWYQEVWDQVRSSPSNLAVGVGFGQVLINFENEQGIPVRQPHNSSLTVLARVGFVGLSIWLLFIGLVIVRYVRFLRTPYITAGVSTLVLWLFLQFILTLLDASVQPSLEFSHGAIPFYFLLGLGFATMRSSYDNPDLRRPELGEPQGTDQ